MVAQRAPRLLIAALVFSLAFSGIAIDGDAKRNRHKKPHHRGKPDTVEVQSSTIPWAEEQTVTLHYWGPGNFADAYTALVATLNELTEYMPNAPTWLFVDHTEHSCSWLNSHEQSQSGINVCGEEPDDDEYWTDMAPAGGAPGSDLALKPICGDYAAIGTTTQQRRHGEEDGWYTKIVFEATTTVADLRCYNVYEARFGIAQHEGAHAILGIGHVPGSTTAPPYPNPWGPADFARAEEMFGESTVPFCGIYPDSAYC